MKPTGLPDLEFKCSKCWGSGLLPLEDHGEMIPCPDCGGLGWIPTDEGNRLLDFLQRHLAFRFEEEDEE